MNVVKTHYHRPKEATPRRGRDQRGEGVISAAIAVLVMAFLGAAMWIAFKATFQTTQSNVDKQVNCIGSQQSC
jgi:hypothetical protein